MRGGGDFSPQNKIFMKFIEFALISGKTAHHPPGIFYLRCWLNFFCPSKTNTSNTNSQLKQKIKVRIDFMGLILFWFLTCLENFFKTLTSSNVLSQSKIKSIKIGSFGETSAVTPACLQLC